MGDKPSVEAKSFPSDIGDHNLYQFAPVNTRDEQASADVADTSLTDCALNSFNDSSGLVATTPPDVLVNGLVHSCYASPSLSSRLACSPKRKMKQSKSANHNVNGDTTASWCRDGKHSMSMEAKLTSADAQLSVSSAADNSSVASDHNEAAAAANNSALVESPSPSSSSTVTVVSLVHADNDGRCQKSGVESVYCSIITVTTYNHNKTDFSPGLGQLMVICHEINKKFPVLED